MAYMKNTTCYSLLSCQFASWPVYLTCRSFKHICASDWVVEFQNRRGYQTIQGQGILELVGSAPARVELLASTLLKSPPPELLFIEIPDSTNTFFFSLKVQKGHNTSCWSYLIGKQNTRKRKDSLLCDLSVSYNIDPLHFQNVLPWNKKAMSVLQIIGNIPSEFWSYSQKGYLWKAW